MKPIEPIFCISFKPLICMCSEMTKPLQKSAEIVAANEDLLMEILLRLPVKSLLRFKCVSTQWLHLISNNYFSQTHSLKNPRNSSTSGIFIVQNPSILFLSLETGETEHSRASFGTTPVSDFLKTDPFDTTSLVILSSCFGLLLCLLLLPPPWENDMDVVYLVYNPTTNGSNPLPPLDMRAEKPIVNMDLAFDPRESPHYRVVCIRNRNPPDGPEFEIQIFSSETGSWRTCRGPFLGIPKGTLFQGGVYWNKGINYLNSSGGDSFYFDVEDESLGDLPMLPRLQTGNHAVKRSWNVGSSGGHLHLVDIRTIRDSLSVIDIYELSGDRSAWAVRYRVDLAAMGFAFPEMVQHVEAYPFLQGIRVRRYCNYCVLSVVQKEDDRDFLEVVLSIPNKIVCYNPRNNNWRVLVYFENDEDRMRYDWNSVVQYVETLVPV